MNRVGHWGPRAMLGLAATVVSLIALSLWAMPPKLRIPRLQPVALGAPPSVSSFSHRRHGHLPCYSCHPTVFPQALLGFRHAQMNDGRYCGACHDGVRASDFAELSCETCHEKH